jgi:nitrogen fixation protein NifU and related proteins
VTSVPPYLATVVEHYRRPHNQRALAAPTHVHEGVNTMCGDRMRIELEVRGAEIVDATFAASACAIATASASLLTDRVRGQRLAELETLRDEEVIAALGDGVPVARHPCATLPLRLLRLALAKDA